MAWIRCCGSSAKKYININIGNLAINSPTPTTASPTNRTFIKNAAVKGLSASNYYYPNYCTVTRLTDNSVKVVGSNSPHYSYGYVLPDIVKGGMNLRMSITRSTQTSSVTVAYYKADGTNISYSVFFPNGSGGTEKEDTIAIPADAEYIIVQFTPVNTSATGVDFTLNSINVE